MQHYLSDCLKLMLLMTILPLAVSSFCGFLLAILQAATQIQEQSLGFLLKYLICMLVLYLAGGWYLDQLCLLFTQSLRLLLQVRV